MIGMSAVGKVDSKHVDASIDEGGNGARITAGRAQSGDNAGTRIADNHGISSPGSIGYQ